MGTINGLTIRPMLSSYPLKLPQTVSHSRGSKYSLFQDCLGCRTRLDFLCVVFYNVWFHSAFQIVRWSEWFNGRCATTWYSEVCVILRQLLSVVSWQLIYGHWHLSVLAPKSLSGLRQAFSPLLCQKNILDLTSFCNFLLKMAIKDGIVSHPLFPLILGTFF